MSLSIPTQESQLQHESPRRPTTVGHRGLKKKSRQGGHSTSKWTECEKPLPHRHRHKVRNPIYSTICSCGISTVSTTVEPARPTQQGHRPPREVLQLWNLCGLKSHSFLHCLDHRHLSLTTAGMRVTWQLWDLDCLLHDLQQELGNLVKFSRPAPVEPARHAHPRRRPPCQ